MLIDAGSAGDLLVWGRGKEMEGGNPALILLRKAGTLTAGGNYLLQILWVLSVVSCGWRDTPQKWNGLSEKRGQWPKGRIFPTVTGIGITWDGVKMQMLGRARQSAFPLGSPGNQGG